MTAYLGRHVWPVLLLLICGGAVPAAGAADDGQQALDLFHRMAAAARTLNYDGVFVYQRGGQTDTMRIIHRADDKGEQERLISLTGQAREVIRNNETVTCIFPESNAVVVEKSRPRKLFPAVTEPVSDIVRHYRFGMVGQDRVAGRPAWVIGIQPRSAFRYGYRIWIDTENHLLLRSDVINSHGVSLEQILFTQLSLPRQVPEELLRPAEGTGLAHYVPPKTIEIESASQPAEGRWMAQWVPDGFAMTERQVENMATDEAPVEHIVYSDGLAMVSVFVERLDNSNEPLQGFSSMGAVNAFSMVENDYQITVVGEVPPLTVRQIAASVVPVSASK